MITKPEGSESRRHQVENVRVPVRCCRVQWQTDTTDRYSGCGGRVMRASAAAPSCWLLQLVVMMSAACCGCQHVSVTQSLGPVDETRSC